MSFVLSHPAVDRRQWSLADQGFTQVSFVLSHPAADRRQWSLADQDHLRYKDLLAWDTAMMALDDRFDFLSNKWVWESVEMCGEKGVEQGVGHSTETTASTSIPTSGCGKVCVGGVGARAWAWS